MATTTNYGWATPDDTDLVKDGAAAIRTLGSSVDTTTKNLNPQTTTGALAFRSATANVNTALPLGTAGQVLAVNSGATAPVWVAAPGGGKILQVVSAAVSTLQSITSTVLVDTNITATITPTSATSKIMVLITFGAKIDGSGTQIIAGGALLRGATNIQSYGSDFFGGLFIGTASGTALTISQMIGLSFLDSPATTSATTYKLQAVVNSGRTLFINSGSVPASIILMEVAV